MLDAAAVRAVTQVVYKNLIWVKHYSKAEKPERPIYQPYAPPQTYERAKLIKNLWGFGLGKPQKRKQVVIRAVFV
jgi:5,10-methylenetetrahydrofolate reductase